MRKTVLSAALLLAGCGTAGTIDSFQACVDAGYPVMESFPRQCRTADGLVFTEPEGVSSVNPDDRIIYFGTNDAEEGQECTTVVAMLREDGPSQDPERAALEVLLQGPTQEEQGLGMHTAIPEGVRLQSLEIENGIARVDFSKELQNYGGGSCRVELIRTQITETLLQFPDIQNVVISVDGQTEEILQP